MRDFGKVPGLVFDEYIEDVLSGEIVTHQYKAVDRVLSIAQPPKGSWVLVQGCGTGTEGVYLTKLGYNVVGIDISEDQKKVAMMRFQREGICFYYILGDMTLAPLRSNIFDLVVNMNIAFGFFGSEETDQQVLFEAQRLLKPGGKFFGEFINIDYALSYPENCPECGEFDPETKMFSLMRLYTKDEWKRLIEIAGLKLMGVWGGPGGSADYSTLTPQTKYILLLATKP
ncbi:MAG: hypothetical protein DRQ08_08625 [Candidatus Latescibacterota bacterium]|nr:MAG: hypothetical protein DRQ08_08625 [Candidatus Latescibacterota bacterium]